MTPPIASSSRRLFLTVTSRTCCLVLSSSRLQVGLANKVGLHLPSSTSTCLAASSCQAEESFDAQTNTCQPPACSDYMFQVGQRARLGE